VLVSVVYFFEESWRNDKTIVQQCGKLLQIKRYGAENQRIVSKFKRSSPEGRFGGKRNATERQQTKVAVKQGHSTDIHGKAREQGVAYPPRTNGIRTLHV
jgi:hypothetical protein